MTLIKVSKLNVLSFGSSGFYLLLLLLIIQLCVQLATDVELAPGQMLQTGTLERAFLRRDQEKIKKSFIHLVTSG